MHRIAPVTIAALALVALVGCAPAADPLASDAPSTPASPQPTASTLPEPSTQPEGIDTSDWLEYSTRDGDMAYRYPSDWTLESTADAIPGGGSNRWYDSASLTAPSGQRLLQSSDYVDIGGACGEDYQFPMEVLASEPAEASTLEGQHTAELTTVAIGTDDGRWTFGVGITASELLPEPGETGCGWYFVHGGASIGTHFLIASIEDDPLWTVDTLDDAEAYMETDEYATILEILRSVRMG